MTAIPTLRTTSRGSLIPLVDYLLGFRPVSSTVIIFLTGTTVQVTARIDNEDLGRPELAEQMATAAERVGADHCYLVSYDALDEHIELTHRLTRPLVEMGVELDDHLLVSERSWYSTASGEQGPLDDLATDPIACERVYQGKLLAASREELAAQVEPGRDLPSDAFQAGYQAMDEAMRVMGTDDVVRAIGILLDSDEHDDHQLGEIVALGRHRASTEPALARIRCENASRWLDLWSRLVRLTEGKAAELPLAAAGCAAWAAGHGVEMLTALDELKTINPEHPIGRVLAHAHAEVLPPDLWDQFAMRLEADVPGVPG